PVARRPHQTRPLGTRYRRLRTRVAWAAASARGRPSSTRNRVPSTGRTGRLSGTRSDYLDRYRAERLKRHSLDPFQRLGYQVTLTRLPTAARLRRILTTEQGFHAP